MREERHEDGEQARNDRWYGCEASALDSHSLLRGSDVRIS